MILIPMAGLSQRFTNAGYKLPKYMLPIGDQTAFDYSVASFEALFDQERFVFVYRAAQDGAKDFIETRLRDLGLRQFDLVPLDRETSGQAETCYLALEMLGELQSEDQFTIFNIDTRRTGFTYPNFSDTETSGFIEVFNEEGSHWSFVEPLENNPDVARRVVEKERISDLCCNGLYNFSKINLFTHAYESGRDKVMADKGETYVAPLYNELIAEGHTFHIRKVERENVIIFGTPDEYEALRAAG